MRVIAGSARRIQLKTIEGMDTRPTQDRIKETLFNMLQYDIIDTNFLDLFGGSGGIGIEALSRGAKYCVFVEQSPAAADCIRQNLEATHLTDQAMLMQCDALSALKRLEDKDYYFDYVFMDPPYNQELEKQMLTYLKNSKLIDSSSTIIIEAALDTDFEYLTELGYEVEKNKKYKTNRHIFVRRGE